MNESNTMNELFEKESIPKAYFKLALPVVISMVVNMVYNLIDTFFIAKTQNPDMVAAVTVCTPLFSFMIAMGDIFGLGGSSAVSRFLGKRQNDTAKRISSFCLYASIVFSFLVTFVLLIFEHPILKMLGATQATYTYASGFYRIMSVGAVFIIASLVPTNLLRTEGLAKESMIGSVGGTFVTIILDPIFIFGCHMGPAGASLATVLGYLITDLIYIYMVLTRCKVITLSIKFSFNMQKEWIKNVILIGIPASVTNLMQSFGLALLNRYLVPYGTDQLAALGIVTKVYMIITLIMVGFAFGAQPLIGYNYGAQNMQRFKKIIDFDILVEVVYAVTFAIILMLIAPFALKLFMNDPQIIHSGTYMLRALLSSTPFFGAVLVFTTVFQSANKALDALIMSITRQGIILLIVIVILSNLFHYHGVIWSQPVSDVLTCLLGFMIYKTTFKNKKSSK